LGIVAEVSREIEVADWLDQQEPSHRQYVSVGTARVAMALNGLGFSNRRLYLTPQFYADKPVEHLLGPGIQAEELNNDCLGRTLDRLYEHDVTRLFAGLALQARRAFGTRWGGLHANHQQQKYALACRHVLVYSLMTPHSLTGTAPHGGGQFGQLSQSLDSMVDSPYPS
jgi:transposase